MKLQSICTLFIHLSLVGLQVAARGGGGGGHGGGGGGHGGGGGGGSGTHIGGGVGAAGAYNSSNSDSDNNRKKRKTAILVLCIVLPLVAILAGLAMVWWFVWGRRRKRTQPEDEEGLQSQQAGKTEEQLPRYTASPPPVRAEHPSEGVPEASQPIVPPPPPSQISEPPPSYSADNPRVDTPQPTNANTPVWLPMSMPTPQQS